MKSRVALVITMMSVLTILFSLSSLPIVHAIQEQTPDISGGWAASAIVTFDQLRCRGDANQDAFLFSIFVDQVGDQLKVTSSEFNIENKEIFSPSSFEMRFLSPNNLQSNASYDFSKGKMILDINNIILSGDCNNMAGSLLLSSIADSCNGAGDIIFKRKNPTGCGIKCVENWTCSDWGNCNNGTQKRLCFDNNSCKNESSRPAESQSCQMPLPAIVPAKKDSTWLYLIIILAILVATTATFLLRMQLGKRKNEMIGQLRGGIENIHAAMNRGDRMEAMNQYKLFGERFAEYRPFIKEEEYNRLYDDVLKAYNRILQSNSVF